MTDYLTERTYSFPVIRANTVINQNDSYIYFYMRAIDVDAPGIEYVYWTVRNTPDFTASQYNGPKVGASPLSDIVVIDKKEFDGNALKKSIFVPDSNNLIELWHPVGPYYSDNYMNIISKPGNLVKTWTGFVNGLHLNSINNSPILREDGVSFGEDGYGNELFSSASSYNNQWSLYILCDASTLDGTIAKNNPEDNAVLKSYTNVTARLDSGSYATVSENVSMKTVKGIVANGTSCEVFIQNSFGANPTFTSNTVIGSAKELVLTIGSTTSIYQGKIKAIAFFNTSHDATKKSQVIDFLYNLV